MKVCAAVAKPSTGTAAQNAGARLCIGVFMLAVEYRAGMPRMG